MRMNPTPRYRRMMLRPDGSRCLFVVGASSEAPILTFCIGAFSQLHIGERDRTCVLRYPYAEASIN